EPTNKNDGQRAVGDEANGGDKAAAVSEEAGEESGCPIGRHDPRHEGVLRAPNDVGAREQRDSEEENHDAQAAKEVPKPFELLGPVRFRWKARLWIAARIGPTKRAVNRALRVRRTVRGPMRLHRLHLEPDERSVEEHLRLDRAC